MATKDAEQAKLVAKPVARKDAEQAAVTIPAAYLEDVRSALAKEIEIDGDALRADQAKLVAGVRLAAVGGPKDTEFRRSDRDGAMDTLSKDLQLLEQLRSATGDTKLTGEVGTLTHTLDATVRVLRDHLKDVCQYGPLPMHDVVELSARLRWAADEGIRLWPEALLPLSDDEAVA